MSIATLKKKTEHLYKTQSTEHSGFSINGTRRSQGWVGQTMLSRSFPRTLARGNVARGHGGLYGSYNDNLSITSGLVDLNDSSVVKSSVLGTNGMINTHFNWIRRPFPCSSTKPNLQSSQTTRVKNCAINAVEEMQNNSCYSNTTKTNNVVEKQTVDTYTLVLNTTKDGVYNDTDFSYYTPTDRRRTLFEIDWSFLPTNIQYFNVEFEFLDEFNYFNDRKTEVQDILIQTNFQNLTSLSSILGCAELIEDNRNLYTRHISKFKDNAPITIYRPTQDLKVDILDSSYAYFVSYYDIQYVLTLHFTPVL